MDATNALSRQADIAKVANVQEWLGRRRNHLDDQALRPASLPP
jgi:hypothetical protein